MGLALLLCGEGLLFDGLGGVIEEVEVFFFDAKSATVVVCFSVVFSGVVDAYADVEHYASVLEFC